MAVRKIDGKLLKAWYKKHSKPGVRGKSKMLVLNCPKFGKVCAAMTVCLNEKYKTDDAVIHRRHCEFYGGLEFGFIICTHPKAE